jgi:hypothetical protein
LVFITVVEGVYSAVRTDALYKADYVSPFKVKDGEKERYKDIKKQERNRDGQKAKKECQPARSE